MFSQRHYCLSLGFAHLEDNNYQGVDLSETFKEIDRTIGIAGRYWSNGQKHANDNSSRNRQQRGMDRRVDGQGETESEDVHDINRNIGVGYSWL